MLQFVGLPYEKQSGRLHTACVILPGLWTALRFLRLTDIFLDICLPCSSLKEGREDDGINPVFAFGVTFLTLQKGLHYCNNHSCAEQEICQCALHCHCGWNGKPICLSLYISCTSWPCLESKLYMALALGWRSSAPVGIKSKQLSRQEGT